MPYQTLEQLAKSKNWAELEQQWLSAIEAAPLDAAKLLAVIDGVVEAGQEALASTMAWIWLSTVKESKPAKDALQLGRALLLRLPEGEDLREEILSLYRQTHPGKPDLEDWIDRSGFKSGKSVRRALRFLEVGLRLAEGVCLVNRSENEAAEITEYDVAGDLVVVRTQRRPLRFDVAHLIEDWDIAPENDFRVLSQLRPQRLAELVEADPPAVAIGILRSHGGRMDRDQLKFMLVPRFLPAERWSDWWGKIREAVKRSRNLRVEGRSPMFLIYDEVGQSIEEEVWTEMEAAQTPRDWSDALDRYFREAKLQKIPTDEGFLRRVRETLSERLGVARKHGELESAFSMALIIDKLAAEAPGVGSSEGLAVQMLREAKDPVAVTVSITDARLWSMAVDSVQEAFPDRWPSLFAELLLSSPGAQCDDLASRIEKAGHGELLPPVIDQVLSEPGQFTDALMWLWKGASVQTPLPLPAPLEMLGIILGLVGPARTSAGRNVGQTANEMKATIRAGLSAKSYEQFRRCLDGMEDVLAQTLRRQIERAGGLGPRVQEDMLTIMYERFPKLYVKPKLQSWEDDSVMYFTQSALDAKEAELAELVNVKMRENAKAIGEAAAHGDLSENSEYKFALEERDLLRARAAQLNREVSMARVLHPQDVPEDHVSIGQRLTLRPVGGGEPLVMTVSGAGDADLANRVFSYQTPLAHLLLGKRVGETAALSLDDAQEREYVIERIECAIT